MKSKQVKLNFNYFLEFFIACLVLGLEYCHTNNIIHRDIKPENLVLDGKGYVKITDFGIAKPTSKNNSDETSGTPGYMAPEVLCALNHGTVVDYFAVGVIGYEFMKGERPYLGKNRKEIKERVLARQVQVKKNFIPQGWSTDAADFINKTLQRKPSVRLGLRGAIEIKEHSWFKYYPWKDLYLGKVKSPFIPKSGDNFDAKYCNKKEQLGVNTSERYAAIRRNPKAFYEFKINFLDFNRLQYEKENKNSTYHLQKFKNPHDIYVEEDQETNSKNEKNSVDSGSTIFNRNMLSNKSTDDESTEKILYRYGSTKNLLAYNKEKESSSKNLNNSMIIKEFRKKSMDNHIIKKGKDISLKKMSRNLSESSFCSVGGYTHKKVNNTSKPAGKKY